MFSFQGMWVLMNLYIFRIPKVPDTALVSRFKHNFEPYIKQMFHYMVDYTELISQAIESSLAQMLTFDASAPSFILRKTIQKYLIFLSKI